MTEFIEKPDMRYILHINSDKKIEKRLINFCLESVVDVFEDTGLTADLKPVKQWMKLHEKHPDTEGFYLVCDQYGECEVAEYLPDIKSWFTHKVNGEIRYWMPLPKLPKEGEQNG